MFDILITIVTVLVIFFLWVIIFDTNRFVIREYKIENSKLHKKCRAVVLSDLHNKRYGKNNEKLVEAIECQNPDFILIAGDMITSRKKAPTKGALELLRRLVEKYPVYYGNGNHEYRLRNHPEKYGSIAEEYLSALQEMGIAPLENMHLELPAYNIDIYGLQIDYKYYERFQAKEMEDGYISGLLGERDKSKFTILLAHNPDFFADYAKWGADLTVSGHIHGGIARVPVWGKGVISPTFAFFPKYDGGIFCENEAVMVLSRGLGTHSLPIRVFNPGELCVIDFIP